MPRLWPPAMGGRGKGKGRSKASKQVEIEVSEDDGSDGSASPSAEPPQKLPKVSSQIPITTPRSDAEDDEASGDHSDGEEAELIERDDAAVSDES